MAGFSLRYYDSQSTTWEDSWDSSQQNNSLPAAVEVTLALEAPDKSTDGTPRVVRYTRIFQCPCTGVASDSPPRHIDGRITMSSLHNLACLPEAKDRPSPTDAGSVLRTHSPGSRVTAHSAGPTRLPARHGIIFVTAMWVILILGALVLIFARSMRVEVAASANHLSEVQASTIELGRSNMFCRQSMPVTAIQPSSCKPPPSNFNLGWIFLDHADQSCRTITTLPLESRMNPRS